MDHCPRNPRLLGVRLGMSSLAPGVQVNAPYLILHVASTHPLASSADDVIPALHLAPWPCRPGSRGFVRLSPPPPTCGGRRPDGGGGPELKEAWPGRGRRARRQSAGLHTIARLRPGPKVPPHGGRSSSLPHTSPTHCTSRLRGVLSAITGSSQSPVPLQSPRSPQSPQSRLPSASAPRPLIVPAGAPPAPRGPQRPALQTPGLKEPGASGVRRTRGGRPRTLPRSLRVWPPPGGGGAERAQKLLSCLKQGLLFLLLCCHKLD
uniref:translation initiation factor IF-2-like n=1 Tax=Arvicanthis niloticus TaxID=61156 RepID=UPI00148621FC|nr:translation initiation factor IF-2-like [Arvicanthis niloticus]